MRADKSLFGVLEEINGATATVTLPATVPRHKKTGEIIWAEVDVSPKNRVQFPISIHVKLACNMSHLNKANAFHPNECSEKCLVGCFERFFGSHVARHAC